MSSGVSRGVKACRIGSFVTIRHLRRIVRRSGRNGRTPTRKPQLFATSRTGGRTVLVSPSSLRGTSNPPRPETRGNALHAPSRSPGGRSGERNGRPPLWGAGKPYWPSGNVRVAPQHSQRMVSPVGPWMARLRGCGGFSREQASSTGVLPLFSVGVFTRDTSRDTSQRPSGCGTPARAWLPAVHSPRALRPSGSPPNQSGHQTTPTPSCGMRRGWPCSHRA